MGDNDGGSKRKRQKERKKMKKDRKRVKYNSKGKKIK
jgi:hypothetical protein